MGEYGSMCPLLDILNHDPSRNWLNLVINPDDGNLLDVITNYDIAEGAEIYYNYGALSNEQLLYGYGYAVTGNPFDSVAVKLMAANLGTSNNNNSKQTRAGMDNYSDSKHVGTYYVRRGGLEGIPEVL